MPALLEENTTSRLTTKYWCNTFATTSKHTSVQILDTHNLPSTPVKDLLAFLCRQAYCRSSTRHYLFIQIYRYKTLNLWTGVTSLPSLTLSCCYMLSHALLSRTKRPVMLGDYTQTVTCYILDLAIWLVSRNSFFLPYEPHPCIISHFGVPCLITW